MTDRVKNALKNAGAEPGMSMMSSEGIEEHEERLEAAEKRREAMEKRALEMTPEELARWIQGI